MPIPLANAILVALGVYLLAGAVLAVVLHAGGLRRIDATAARGSPGFRAVITPGLVLLWPVLLPRWWRGAGAPPAPRDAHRDAARREASR